MPDTSELPAASIRKLDHLAMVVPDTEAALQVWRDRLGFPVVHSECVNDGTIRLTHLDLGNTHLQLVQPLVPDHPLNEWLNRHGAGLHHFCFEVEDVDAAANTMGKAGLAPAGPGPHQGILGKRARFLDANNTQNVLVEITGK